MYEIVRHEPEKKKRKKERKKERMHICDKTSNARIVILIKPCLTFAVLICLNSQINYMTYYFFYSPYVVFSSLM